MTISGRIFDIITFPNQPNVAQIIIRKKIIEYDKQLIVPVAFVVIGKYKRIALEEMQLKNGEMIRGEYIMKSSKYKDKNGNERYGTDVQMRTIVRIDDRYKPVSINPNGADLWTDTDTGEIHDY